ncbi:NAD(P)H-dependent oxidoreductase [Neisseria perflava]|uniref:NAD(P)H-dependent oxidoreductase n=1 Tax=Neisseria perflava TaxID=33053 RepID=UPI00209C6F6B|nr:NAD(P)H-dependent oxidoreductase [Neisseria perflava]MCP1660686.1 nitroreductase [Neisseria perflava]MCP1771866.1 nitroreductase [Neisseria perflava]
MIHKQDILDAYHFRHACKAYDPSKKIPQEDFDLILETARLSPSSFGFEPWKLIVLENPAIRRLLDVGGAQGKAVDASHFVLFVVRQQADLTAGSDYLKHQMQDIMHMPAEVQQGYTDFFRHYSEKEATFAHDPRLVHEWAARQSYIALGNMLTTAAMLGIDSTPIEGFNYAEFDQLLSDRGVYDKSRFKLSVMATFGYRAGEPKHAKTHRPMSEAVEYFK